MRHLDPGDPTRDLAPGRTRTVREWRSCRFEHERVPAPPAQPLRGELRRGAASLEHRVPRSLFGDLVVLARIAGPRLPITSAAGLARQLRRALMPFADQPVPEVISGHRPDGDAAEAPHLAVVPLPDLAGPRIDGSLLGIALVLPRAIDGAAHAAVTRALARFEDRHRIDGAAGTPTLPLLLGDAGVLVLQRRDARRAARELAPSLRPATWTSPSRRWASATPIALDRNPGDLLHADPARRAAAHAAAKACVIEAVRRIGLPSPAEVDVSRSPVLPGTAPPGAYPRFPIDPLRPQRILVHASLTFRRPVLGPVLAGAGRYQGLGLCLPIDDRDDD